MKNGYESLAWGNDKDAKEYVCTLENPNNTTSFEQLSNEEKANCSDVSQIVGTERW